MLPVIEKFTGTEYSTAGFVITAILMLGITALAGYITGKSAAESFGGNKKKTAVVFHRDCGINYGSATLFFRSVGKGGAWGCDVYYHAVRGV